MYIGKLNYYLFFYFDKSSSMFLWFLIFLLFLIHTLLIPISILTYFIRFFYHKIMIIHLKNKHDKHNFSNEILKYYNQEKGIICLYYPPHPLFMDWTEIVLLFID